MNSNGVLVVVKDYERDKIYRLTRRYEALINLLDTTVSKDKSDCKFIQEIKDSLNDCERRQKNWWDRIYKKYNLEKYSNHKLRISIFTGEIVLD